jgi:two-component system, cell cycle sensor histidine kinase and response regulator CckA
MERETHQRAPASDQGLADALWIATERLRALQDAAPVAIVAFDQDARVTLWNATAERLFGWRTADVLGQCDPLTSEHQETEYRAWRTRVLQGEILSGVETWCRCRNGAQTLVSLSAVPLRDRAGRWRGMMAVLSDITEQKRLEQQFQRAQRMEAVGKLSGGIAHDFNNLLTAILGYANMLLEQIREDKPMWQDLQQIRRAAERAASLTRQLLAFSRQQVLQPQVLDLNAIVSRLAMMLGRLLGEDIRLITLLAHDLSAVKVDATQLEQVLLNLITNARDAMPTGGTLTIATTNVHVDEALARSHAPMIPGRYIQLTVTDTGEGMDAITQARIFEPFFTTKATGSGTGLGLSTAYGIVKQSGGYIWVDSRPQHGSRFTIYLPRTDERPKLDPSRPEPLGTLHVGTEVVLMVEDDPVVRGFVETLLRRYGYRLHVAASPAEACHIEAQLDGPIDLILTDVVLPEMSGLDLVKHLTEKRPDAKVIYMSGYPADALGHLGSLEAGTVFLQKPFTPADLAGKVRQLLGG